MSEGLEDMQPDVGDGTFLVPVRFHVIHDGINGNVGQNVLDEQINVLNTVFEPHGFRFHQWGEPNRERNPAWYRMKSGGAEEKQARDKLQKEPGKSLNFYLADVQKYAGWAQHPWDLEAHPLWDGVVVHNRYLPGGEPPYDGGMTAVHEVGHWLGLLHTYEGWDEKKAPEGGCKVGDDVDDTPHEASPASGPGVGRLCPATDSRDTCKSDRGWDPIENYMDTADDRCMTHFTAGQVARMREQTARFRTGLPVSYDCRPRGALSQPSRDRLSSNLRRGGLVIALRHADKADDGGLTDPGQQQADRIGRALGELPISKVFHNREPSRVPETAKRLPGKRKPSNSFDRPGGLGSFLSGLRERKEGKPLANSNFVVVTRSFNFNEEERGHDVACGEALILDPEQPVGQRCLARILSSEWSDPTGPPPTWTTADCRGGALTVRPYLENLQP